MRVTFLDSSYFLALIHRGDPLHDRAQRWQRVARGEFVTTEYVLVELLDALAAPDLRELGVEIGWLLRNDPSVSLLPASTLLLEEGFRLFHENGHSAWSLTDCISFATMRHTGTRDVLTTNPHYEQAGFRSLLRIEPPDLRRVAPDLRAAICRAIGSGRLIQFEYSGGTRVVEPYRYGRGVMGHELLHAYQREGYSQSGQPMGWKTFRLADMDELVVLDQFFAGPRPAYSPAESKMTEVYCQV